MDTKTFAEYYGKLLMAFPIGIAGKRASSGAMPTNTGIKIMARFVVDIGPLTKHDKIVNVLSRCDLSNATANINLVADGKDGNPPIRYDQYLRCIKALVNYGGCKRFSFTGVDSINMDYKFNKSGLPDVEYISCEIDEETGPLLCLFNSCTILEMIPIYNWYTLRNMLPKALSRGAYQCKPKRVDISFGDANRLCFAHTLQFIGSTMVNGRTEENPWPYQLGIVKLCGFNMETPRLPDSTEVGNDPYKASMDMTKSVSDIWENIKMHDTRMTTKFPIGVKSLFIAISKFNTIQVDETTNINDLPIIAKIAVHLFKPMKEMQ
jgi:hypothetical protein